MAVSFFSYYKIDDLCISVLKDLFYLYFKIEHYLKLYKDLMYNNKNLEENEKKEKRHII